ncbi:MAG: hypothetical protein JSS63_01335 [Bacteroidetes bacterium]|nr:hypothetical protein [Bacteroidota bacterium]
MKIILLLFFFTALFFVSKAFADPTDDIKKEIIKVTEKVEELDKNVKTLEKKNEESIKTLTEKFEGISEYKKDLDTFEKIIIWITPVMFLFFSFLCIIFLLKSRFDLGDTLSEYVEIPKFDSSGNAVLDSNKNQVNESVKKKSSSRFIAFFSGLAAIIISLSIATFTIYRIIKYPYAKLPDFSNLLAFIIPLGIGVIPYSFNKVADAFKN